MENNTIIRDKQRIYDLWFNLHSFYAGFFLAFLLITYKDVPWYIVLLLVSGVCWATSYVAIILWEEGRQQHDM